MKRPIIEGSAIYDAQRLITHDCFKRLAKHGPSVFAGRHEALGIITEEYFELVEAARLDDDPERFIRELEDIAVACVLAIASFMSLAKPEEGQA